MLDLVIGSSSVRENSISSTKEYDINYRFISSLSNQFFLNVPLKHKKLIDTAGHFVERTGETICKERQRINLTNPCLPFRVSTKSFAFIKSLKDLIQKDFGIFLSLASRPKESAKQNKRRQIPRERLKLSKEMKRPLTKKDEETSEGRFYISFSV